MDAGYQIPLYFAYGSNMSLAQMQQILGDVRVVGCARLPQHKIGFYGHSVKWDGAVETVVPDVDSDVWGVLYEVGAYDWDALDNFQDARLDGTGEYFHYPVEVFDEHNVSRTATLYKKAELREAKHPSTEYVEVMIAGAREQGVPQSYIDILQKIVSKSASYPVPRQRKKQVSLASGCEGCV